MGQKQKRIRQKEQQDKAEEQKMIEKWDQTESPEIPDRKETSEISGFPSGERETL